MGRPLEQPALKMHMPSQVLPGSLTCRKSKSTVRAKEGTAGQSSMDMMKPQPLQGGLQSEKHAMDHNLWLHFGGG